MRQHGNHADTNLGINIGIGVFFALVFTLIFLAVEQGVNQFRQWLKPLKREPVLFELLDDEIPRRRILGNFRPRIGK